LQIDDILEIFHGRKIEIDPIGVPMDLNLDYCNHILLQLHAGYDRLSDSKIGLFGLICAVVTVACMPVILPHITHPSMIYHIILHVASLAVALFLCYIAVVAYLRLGKVRLLFMSLGFITLALVEALMLLAATGNLENTIIPQVNVELPHVILLVMLTLFGAGVLKVN
jgi:hypothetical protein